MKRIGLTGNMGTGKSTVAWILSEHGIPVIDADDIAHKVIAPHTTAWKHIFDRYGKKVLLVDGHIDRKLLAQLVFQSNEERMFIEKTIHPHVEEAIEKETANLNHQGVPYCVIEVPLLFEAKWETKYDLIVVVTCNEDEEIKRSEEKFGLSREEVLLRLKAQWPLEKKLAKADVIIDNSGTLEETRVQVERLYRAWDKGTFLKHHTPSQGGIHEKTEHGPLGHPLPSPHRLQRKGK